MTEIDRRALVTMAGAGLLLAGCDGIGGPGNRAKPCPKPQETGTGPVGECEDHGDKVTNAGATTHGTFAAKLLCVAYVRFPTGTGGLITYHKYVELAGSETDVQRRTLAQHVLEEIKGAEHGIVYYAQRNDFNKFSFDRPTYIAICVDNREDYVKFNWDAELDDAENLEHIIRFTPFSGHKGYIDLGEEPYKKRKPNKNFYDIAKWSMVNPQNLESTTVVSLHYYNKNEAHQEIPKPEKDEPETWHVYSMNIHLLMAGSSSLKTIPIILDPDTGNMGSEP